MNPHSLLKSATAAALSLTAVMISGPVHGAEKVLIIGDSLSKEYEIEWLGIGGDPFSRPVENWCEILDNRRGSWFEFGGSGTYSDSRLVGHAFNWAIPGSETSDWVSLVKNPPGDLTNQLKKEVNRVVVFLGGNDVRVKYQDLYDGKPAAEWIATISGNIAQVLDFVKTQNPALPVVLANVPHLGCAPDIDGDHPYDVVKTGRVTAALDELNARLTLMVKERSMGLADIYSMTRELVTAPRWVISGYKVEKTSSGSGSPNALFLGDGFHPNMPAQAVFAQRILDAFNDRYGSQIPRLGSREILVDVVRVSADFTLAKWAENFGIPSGGRGANADPDQDGIPNIMEYALDLDPARSDHRHLPRPVVSGKNLILTWQPRDPSGTHSILTVQESADLQNWTNVPTDSISNLEFNTLRISRSLNAGQPLWLRFQARTK